MKTKKAAMPALGLKLFDSAAAAEAGQADSGGSGAAQTGEGNSGLSDAAKGNRAKKTPLSDVKYGKQKEGGADMAAAATDTEDGEDIRDAAGEQTTAAPKRERFEQLINGDYKDLFAQRVQGIIDKRFKQTKALQSQVDKLGPVIELLSAKYGETDTDKLIKAIQDDDSYYEREAAQKNMTVEQLKNFKKMERENLRLKKEREQIERRQNAERIYSDWLKQSEQVKTIYPSFDLNDEIQNPDFLKLLKSGVGVKAAYQAVHMDDILEGAMKYTAQKIRQQTVNSIKARAGRPAENGLSSQTGVVVRNDVSRLSAADRREIARRAARGEQIEF